MLHDLQQIKPIPLRVIPQPWENLPSLIMRTAERMGYTSPYWILRPQEAPYEIEPTYLIWLSNNTHYRILQRLLQLDEETLYQGTYHRFVLVHSSYCRLPRRWEIKRPLFSYDIFPGLFPQYPITKVCPICLDDGIPYGRLYWGVNSLVICPQHNVYLIDRCPVCHKPISLFRTSLTHCQKCRTSDFRRIRVMFAREDPYLHIGQKLTMVHLGIQSVEEMRGNDAVEVLDQSPLLDLQPSQYFQLLYAFRHVLPSLFPDNPFLRASSESRGYLRPWSMSSNTFTAYEWQVLATTFPYIFASWPDNFFTFMNELVKERCREIRTGYESRDIGPLGSIWLYKELQDPAFAFLRDAYEAYLKRYYVGLSRIVSQDRFYMTKLNVMTELEISNGELENLIEQGLLRVIQVPSIKKGKKPPVLITRTSIDTLQQEWSNLLPWKKVANSILGANMQIMQQLEKLQWIVQIHGPLIDNYPVLLYRATEVERLVSTLLNLSMPAPRFDQEVLTLFDVLIFERVALVRLFDEAMSGELDLFDTGTGPLFYRLVLTRAEIHRLLDMGKNNQVRSEECGLYTLDEAAWRLNMSKSALLCCVRQGLLTVVNGGEVKSRLLFKTEAIETFHCEYVCRREAARMLGILPNSITGAVKRGWLDPVDVQETGTKILIFRRAEIESLSSKWHY
jgi:hypothetical protein